MRSRIDKLGVNEPEIEKQGANQIIIQLAGVKDPKTASQLIGKTARLELYDLEASLAGPSITIRAYPRTRSLYDLLAREQRKVEGRVMRTTSESKAKRVSRGHSRSRDNALNDPSGSFPKAGVFAVPEGLDRAHLRRPAVVCPGGPQESVATRPHLLLPLLVRASRNPADVGE